MIFSCDVNAANLFFLQQQGKIVLHQKGDFVFRHYEGEANNRNGWLFPVEVDLRIKSEDDKSTLSFSGLTRESIILKDYLQNILEIDSSPNFILLTEEQREVLESCITNHFPEYQISFESDEGDSDYVYSVEKMADLPGKDFQKKRNHVSRFKRTYEENWKFEFFDGTVEQLSKLEDLQKIYFQWKESHNQVDGFLQSEEKSLGMAVNIETYKKLELVAGVLYVGSEPSAFLVASFTGSECLNVHFEKCLEEVAANGGLAVLNQQFAKAVMERFPQCKYLNREEDLNIPGLRKSKLSYKPEFLIKKYYGKIEEK